MYRIMNIARNILYRAKCFMDKKMYSLTGRRPWSRGYNLSKFGFIKKVLSDDRYMSLFKSLDNLPVGYGYSYDERVVEYPWTLSRITPDKRKLLDAGSVLNFKEIVEYPLIKNKQLTIFTLSPERDAFWKNGISYNYGDLRDLPFKDGWFDEICSLSTLGHVGMDNRLYTKISSTGKIGLEAEKAVMELLRVLRPGGRLLISVVFGKKQLIEWNNTPFAEQFDSALLSDLLKNFSSCQKTLTYFYKYTNKGWNISSEEGCQDLEYFNIHTSKSFDLDRAAAARAVALIEVIK